MSSPPEEQRSRVDSPETKEMLHKTKLIQFLDRSTPIILQNDNGPCPLLAICNILLLRNNMNLSSDVAEVSQEKLLSLVAERLIDSNSNLNNKDAGYVENQQQNIADAIDLLPRLTTGIDVNIKFTRIDDFEFTRECAIFDLLDIPLYHGWIVDPQDSDTSSAIGLKSYNTIMGELVALETQNMGNDVNTPEEDYVDFVAATTASLGVPSPSLSRVKSFDISEDKKERKGDLQEEDDLIKALELSVTESPTNNDSDVKTPESLIPGEVCTDSGAENDKPLKISETISANDSDLKKQESVIPEELHPPCSQKPSTDNNGMSNSGDDLTFITVPSQEACCSSQMDNESKDEIVGNDVNAVESTKGKDVISPVDESKSKSKALTTHVDESEPIYEGEEHIQETSTPNYENGEPMYEGEVALAEQVDKGKNGIITPRQGELIRNFLRNSASQLTIYGLFQLQEGLKERELCVFFRNNHFNTMFKFEGELYLLATDQGYINQPDLVWEKLNEVNGDSVFMTGNFKKFNAESQDTSPHTWDEQNALANTADYLASIDNVTQENTGFNSDLQLAIALQQQEFEQQQPQPPPTTTTQSGLVTGPQHVQPSRPKNSSSSSSSSKHESKSSKEKCTVM